MPAGLRVKGKAVVRNIDKISAFVLRYGLVLVVFWIGCLKFTAYESEGVFNHASHSPVLAWAYHILDVRNFSRGLGVVEIATALLIAAEPVWPKLDCRQSSRNWNVLNYAEFCHYDAGSMAGRVWISRPLRVSWPVPGQGRCVVGSGYLDSSRFSEIRRGSKRQPTPNLTNLTMRKVLSPPNSGASQLFTSPCRRKSQLLSKKLHQTLGRRLCNRWRSNDGR